MNPFVISLLRRGARGGAVVLASLVLAFAGYGLMSATGAVSHGSPRPSAGDPVVSSPYGTEYENTGTGPMVRPRIPTTPDVPTYFGSLRCHGGTRPGTRAPAPSDCTRVFHLTATQFPQKIANFPLQTARVWGYQADGQRPSTPGPALISFAGERVQLAITNALEEPTTVHPHGLHQPNVSDGVAGISEPNPIQPGATHVYPAFRAGHIGTFSYHSHFDGAVQDMRGLDGMWDVLPRREHRSVRPDVDVNMTLQIWDWTENGELVKPFGEMGNFPFDTINGKTGDAAGGPITIHRGDTVRIRIYNASQQVHAMHLHGHDEILVSKNGHAVPPTRETTETVSPGDFAEIEFKADNPGNWVFHCHFPHHTANGMAAGYHGAPVGMTRVFHYAGYAPVPKQYFSSAHYMSPTVNE